MGTFNANGATITHEGTDLIIDGTNPTTSAMTLSCSVTTTAASGSCSITTPDISRTNYTAVGWGAAADSTSSSYDKVASMTLDSSNTGQTYYAITTPTDTTCPTITLSNGCIKSGTTVNLTDIASATDASGVTSFTASPSTTSGLSVGTHTVTYTATDPYGCTTTEDFTISIFKQISDDITLAESSEDGLYKDNFDSSRYIYRGTDPNNYITFSGKTWRIISIESDGTYKIAYMGTDISQPYNSSGSGLSIFTDTTLYTYLNTTYYNSLSQKDKIVSHDFENGIVNYARNSTSTTLNDIEAAEESEFVNIKVGLPTLTDVFQASSQSKCNTDSTTFTNLSGVSSSCKSQNWLYNTETAKWTMIPYSDGRIWHFASSLSYGGDLYLGTTSGLVTPVVYLSAGTTVTGSGTSSDPYVVNACSGESEYTCTLDTIEGYQASQTLTINAENSSGTPVTTGITYSFDGETYNDDNTLEDVQAAGSYMAYIKDSSGLINRCSVTLSSQQQWRSASCAVDVTYSSWYTSSTSYTSSCSTYSRTNAEADETTWAREKGSNWLASGYCTGGGIGNLSDVVSSQTTCNNACNGYNSAMGNLCSSQYGGTIECSCSQECILYGRSCSCSSYNSFGSWGTTELSGSCSQKVETQTAYGE